MVNPKVKRIKRKPNVSFLTNRKSFYLTKTELKLLSLSETFHFQKRRFPTTMELVKLSGIYRKQVYRAVSAIEKDTGFRIVRKDLPGGKPRFFFKKRK